MGQRGCRMKYIETNIQGVYILETTSMQDTRGSFSRIFCADTLKNIIHKNIAQINHSITYNIGALRGMHYQRSPYAETKIVRCLQGRVFDVAIDLRHDSPTFLSWTACELTPENGKSLLIPEGCAHGFQVLENNSQLFYLHTEFYTPAAEGIVHYDDPSINIQWPLAPTDLSLKDKNQAYLPDNFSGIMI